MSLDRRGFLKVSVAGAAGATVLGSACGQKGSSSFGDLRPMTDGIVPISDQERWSRIEKAQRLMKVNRIDALYLDGGTSMFYFTGVRWGTSERMFAVIIPALGDPVYVCPKFEEGRARERIRFGDEIGTWEEDESPYK